MSRDEQADQRIVDNLRAAGVPAVSDILLGVNGARNTSKRVERLTQAAILSILKLRTVPTEEATGELAIDRDDQVRQQVV